MVRTVMQSWDPRKHDFLLQPNLSTNNRLFILYHPATTPAAAAAAAPMYAMLRGPGLDSEMGWTKEL